jgi:hypothetical protein
MPSPLLMLVSSLYPKEFPFHPNWRRGEIHPAFWTRGAESDHLVPVAAGGDPDALDNRVTACAVCNTRKADHLLEELDWVLKDAVALDWDGLIGFYRPMWERVGRPSGLHSLWIPALEEHRAPPDEGGPA